MDKLIADAHRSELVSISEFLEYLDVLGDVGARESEAPTEAGGAVQLMTIHKAKGLEFPVVVLADAGYTGAARSEPFYLDEQLGIVPHISDGDSQPAAYRLAALHEAEQQAAEERRLLYVAATRAKEEFIVSGNARLSTAKANPGMLNVTGWLNDLANVVGLSDVQLPQMPDTAESIPLGWKNGAATCTVYPPIDDTLSFPREDVVAPATTSPTMPDLITPLTTEAIKKTDEKLEKRESDPPPRVWRVVPPTQFDVPAWVVGSLTHTALRHWRFPDDNSLVDFADFLRPFALEAGLTDPYSINTSLEKAAKLLTRFQSHPLYTQLSTAERYHEVPYSVLLEGQIQSGIVDLLYRTAPDSVWTIAEFKTDRLPKGVNLETYVKEKRYDQQVQTCRQAVAQQLGKLPEVLFVFLNVGQTVTTLQIKSPH